MKLRRLLPPVVLLAVLGVIVWRAAEKPRREGIQKRVRAAWEDPSAWTRLQLDLEHYVEEYRAPDDLVFASHAFLRIRRPGEAVLARWPDLKRAQVPTLPAAEVRAWSEQALLLLGWEDEERTRRSPVYVQAVMALMEGGNAQAREDLLGRFRRDDTRGIMELMRRGLALPGAAGRALVAATCRDRAAQEKAAGRSSLDWDIAAAALAPKDGPYPERSADVDVLIEVVAGTGRSTMLGRWRLACQALGETGEPRALETLRQVVTSLEATGKDADRMDLSVARMGLLVGGDWSVEPALRGVTEQEATDMASPPALYQEALLRRWRLGDPRARAALDDLWNGPGLQDARVRERLARNQLLGAALPGPDVPVETMLQYLETPGAVPGLAVIAKAFRLRRGEPGAREALLVWLSSKEGEDRTPGGSDPEKALSPSISALRALYLY